MEFIETPTFTRMVTTLLTDDEYRLLQNELVDDPERGAVIEKGGGVRVIYYWLRKDLRIYMLVVYPKSKKDDLTAKETVILRELVKEL